MGVTDALIRIGHSYADATPLPLSPVFEIYEQLAKTHVTEELNGTSAN